GEASEPFARRTHVSGKSRDTCVGQASAHSPELIAPRGAEDLLGGGELLAPEADEAVRVVGRDGDVASVRGGHDQPAIARPETEMHLVADLRGAGEGLLAQARRRRRVEPWRRLASLHGGLVGRGGITGAGVLI